MPTTRRVTLTLEVNTSIPLRDLRRASSYVHDCGDLTVIQAQANVVQTPKPTQRKPARRAR